MSGEESMSTYSIRRHAWPSQSCPKFGHLPRRLLAATTMAIQRPKCFHVEAWVRPLAAFSTALKCV